jgi:hypothetical protein
MPSTSLIYRGYTIEQLADDHFTILLDGHMQAVAATERDAYTWIDAEKKRLRESKP